MNQSSFLARSILTRPLSDSMDIRSLYSSKFILSMKKFLASAVAMTVAFGGAVTNSSAAFAQTTGTQPKIGSHPRIAFRPEAHLEQQAKLLGITADDLKARLSQGKTLVQVAADLDISEDQLKTKMEEARKAELQAMVTSGKLTQAQMDKILSFKGGFDFKGMKQMGHKGPMGSFMLTEQASLLGISADDLKARLDSGKTFQQIASDLGITQDQLKTKMDAQKQARLEKMKADIQAEVAAGKLTQAQADQRLAHLTNPPKHGGKMGMNFGHRGWTKSAPTQAK